jgi:hypothetical protein
MATPRIVGSRVPAGTMDVIVEIVSLSTTDLSHLRTDLEALNRKRTDREEIARRWLSRLGAENLEQLCLAFEAGTGIDLGAMRRRSKRHE